MKIINRTKDVVIAKNVAVADTMASRMRGLLGRKSLDPDEGLIITGCNSIHMFFMKFPIDVIFCDRNDRVVGLIEAIRPFRLSRIYWSSNYAIELPVGTIKDSNTHLGDKLEWDQY